MPRYKLRTLSIVVSVVPSSHAIRVSHDTGLHWNRPSLRKLGQVFLSRRHRFWIKPKSLEKQNKPPRPTFSAAIAA
jgi:hypothetical protein